MHCQPIVGVDGHLYGEEILLRLHEGDHAIAAGEFIDAIAFYPELISRIDWWVIEASLKNCVKEGRRQINVSSAASCQAGFALRFKELADRYGCDPKTIGFEITEQLKVENYQEILIAKSMGIQIVIDDFLTGHNSFKLLQNLRPHAIKIPGELIGQISSQVGLVLVEAIVQVAANLSILAIAESVECEHTWALLKKLAAKYGCELYGQGYLFGRPRLCEAIN